MHERHLSGPLALVCQCGGLIDAKFIIALKNDAVSRHDVCWAQLDVITHGQFIDRQRLLNAIPCHHDFAIRVAHARLMLIKSSICDMVLNHALVLSLPLAASEYCESQEHDQSHGRALCVPIRVMI